MLLKILKSIWVHEQCNVNATDQINTTWENTIKEELQYIVYYFTFIY